MKLTPRQELNKEIVALEALVDNKRDKQLIAVGMELAFVLGQKDIIEVIENRTRK